MTFTLDKNLLILEVNGSKVALSEVDESPCRRACPAGIDVKRYIGQIANGDFAGALKTIRKHMPFPSVCGRICLHPCETECWRGKVDAPISIMALKRFASDYESRGGEHAALPDKNRPNGKKVAIIGTGPSGLTAAHDLAIMGFAVTVFEKQSEPGGMMIQAIPEFELPSAAVRRDIERIREIGVEIKCGIEINGEDGIRDLLADGCSAVLLATGTASRWAGLNADGSWIPGGYAANVFGVVDFMKKFRNGAPDGISPGYKKVSVLGLGVQAISAARTAIRLGAEEVTWIVPLVRDQLQPDGRLIHQAEKEGVKILELSRPVEIVEIEGWATGVKCRKLEITEPDHTGRRLVKETDEILMIDTDIVIDAAWFAPEKSWGSLSSGTWGTVAVDLDSLKTSRDRVFAAGDIATGPKSIVEAVSLGHRAAESIYRSITGNADKIGSLSTPVGVPTWQITDPSRTPIKPYKPSVRPVSERKNDFREAENVYTAWEATQEAKRCLMCGPCDECAVCIASCQGKRGVSIDADGNIVPVRIPYRLAEPLYSGDSYGRDLRFYLAGVNHEYCIGCGVCEEICDYHAPRAAPGQNGGFVSTIDILACKGCGTCVAACPSGAIDQGISSRHALNTAFKRL